MTSATATPPQPTTDRRPARPRPRLVLMAALAALALLATACGGGPGTREEFNEVLTRGENGLSPAEADCISGQVFDRYGDDEDALGKLSAAPDMAFLESAEGIPGFAEFYQEAVNSCLQSGPSN